MKKLSNTLLIAMVLSLMAGQSFAKFTSASKTLVATNLQTIKPIALSLSNNFKTLIENDSELTTIEEIPLSQESIEQLNAFIAKVNMIDFGNLGFKSEIANKKLGANSQDPAEQNADVNTLIAITTAQLKTFKATINAVKAHLELLKVSDNNYNTYGDDFIGILNVCGPWCL